MSTRIKRAQANPKRKFDGAVEIVVKGCSKHGLHIIGEKWIIVSLYELRVCRIVWSCCELRSFHACPVFSLEISISGVYIRPWRLSRTEAPSEGWLEGKQLDENITILWGLKSQNWQCYVAYFYNQRNFDINRRVSAQLATGIPTFEHLKLHLSFIGLQDGTEARLFALQDNKTTISQNSDHS